MGKLDNRPDKRGLKSIKRNLDVLDEEIQTLDREYLLSASFYASKERVQQC